MTSQRPSTIRWFEHAVITSQIVRLLNVALHWKVMAASFGIEERMVLISPFANAFVALGLTLAISRGRLGFGRWFLLIIVGLDATSLLAITELSAMIGLRFAILSTVGIILMIAAAVLMFLPKSGAWLKRDKAA